MKRLLTSLVLALLCASTVAQATTVNPLPKKAHVVLVGDSITQGNGAIGGAVPWYGPFVASVNAARIAAGNGHDTGSPVYYPSGNSGDTIAVVTAAVASRVCNYRPNYVVVQLGTNDATSGRTPTQVTNDAAALITAIRACGTVATNGIIWVGVGLVGDRWPSGANTGDGFDAAIDATNIALAAAATADGNTQFIDIRPTMMTDLVTANPTNTRGASGWVVDVGGQDTSCKHPTVLGSVEWSKIVYSAIPLN